MTWQLRWLFLSAVGTSAAGVILAVAASPPLTQSPPAGNPARGAETTVHKLPIQQPPQSAPAPSKKSLPGEHPLLPVLSWAESELPAIEKINDYSATLVRRERIRGKLTSYEYMFVKIRQEPFSVYVRFESPASVKGQEALYVAGRNGDKMLVHKPRMTFTASLFPDGIIAMNRSRYPLTEIGLLNLVHRLVEVGTEDLKHGECEVKYFSRAKVNGRVCTAIEVVHPMPRDFFRFHKALIFVDDQLKVPVHYASYDWPSEPGEEPPLIETYTYLDLKLNNGFTDQDFSMQNPRYNFPALSRKPEQKAFLN